MADPAISDINNPTFLENTVNATPQVIDSDVTVTDADNDFTGGALTVMGLLSEDSVSVAGGVYIGLVGNTVYYDADGAGGNGAVAIGTASGGVGATFSVVFNAAATAAAITALVESLTYANNSDSPTATRVLTLNIIDAAGHDLTADPTFVVRSGASNPAAGVDVGVRSSANFADIDGDGDADLVMGQIPGALAYFENTGTASAPVYVARSGAANPFDGIDPGTAERPLLIDIDGDHDLDLVVGESSGRLMYWENTGSAQSAALVRRFFPLDPLLNVDIGSWSAPTAGDLDHDGDMDLIVGEQSGQILYLENTGTATAAAFTQRTGTANPFNGVDLGLMTVVTLGDFDLDGDLDLAAGADDTVIHYFENVGTAATPVFVQRSGAANPFAAVSVGAYGAPAAVDVDGDGDLDLMVASYSGTLTYVENTTAHRPTFVVRSGAANPAAGVDVGVRSSANFADIDGDGDADLVMGQIPGALAYFENTGTASAPVYVARSGAANPFDGIDPGTGERPLLIDIDGDHDLDLVVGESSGRLMYWENTGSAQSAALVRRFFPLDPLLNVDIGSWSAPTAGDLDHDGDMDLIVGEQSGQILYLENTGTATAAAFTQRTGTANPFNGVDLGSMSVVTLGDFDLDGDLDLAGGADDTVIHYFENVGTAATPVFVQRTGAANPFAAVSVGAYGAPAAVDIDGDGDLDLMVASYSGTLTYVENTTVHRPTITVTVTPQADGPAPILGTTGVDSLIGTSGADIIDGDAGDDFLDAGAGDDTLTGGAGADYLRGGSGADTMQGGAGNDTYVVTDAGDTADETGGDGVDLVITSLAWTLGAGFENLTLAAPGGAINGTGNSLDNLLLGNSSANVLSGMDGNDTLNGDGGADTLYGGDGNDSLDGSVGNDMLSGEAGIDTLLGGAGADTLDGGTGADTMTGGLGNDSYVVDDSGDTVTELAAEGTDSVSASVSYSLTDNVESLTLTGSDDIAGTGNALRNTITGNAGANVLHGGGEIDTLNGGDGGDTLYGDAGADTLFGQNGDDILFGGAGEDSLTGGAGADRFAFTDLDVRRFALGQTVEKDKILDLSFAAGDRIDLSAIDANTGLAGDQAFSFVSKFTRLAGQAVMTLSAGVTTLQLDVDGDGKADLMIAITGDVTGTTANLYTGGGDVNGGWVL